MAKKVILKLADIQVYSDIADNFKPARLQRFATRVQETQLRELLNDAFYNALINDLDVNGNPQNAPFVALINGKTYEFNGKTVEYFGLKPFLVFHWLSINIREGDIFMSNAGNISFDQNPQDNMVKISQKTIDSINATYLNSIISYTNNITRFLNENQNDYTLWISKSDNASKTSFNIITV